MNIEIGDQISLQSCMLGICVRLPSMWTELSLDIETGISNLWRTQLLIGKRGTSKQRHIMDTLCNESMILYFFQMLHIYRFRTRLLTDISSCIVHYTQNKIIISYTKLFFSQILVIYRLPTICYLHTLLIYSLSTRPSTDINCCFFTAIKNWKILSCALSRITDEMSTTTTFTTTTNLTTTTTSTTTTVNNRVANLMIL